MTNYCPATFTLFRLTIEHFRRSSGNNRLTVMIRWPKEYTLVAAVASLVSTTSSGMWGRHYSTNPVSSSDSRFMLAFHWRVFGPHGGVKEWCAISAHHSLTQPCGPKPRQWKAGLTVTRTLSSQIALIPLMHGIHSSPSFRTSMFSSHKWTRLLTKVAEHGAVFSWYRFRIPKSIRWISISYLLQVG